mmetsp:Transcript_16692/g.34294  ORF Transcript_16692/g.34294 Transcript_16692/m.34294 type:complete len:355 (+) Transcript_16692:1407-2471(+)
MQTVVPVEETPNERWGVRGVSELRRRRTWRQMIRSTSYDQEGGRAPGQHPSFVGHDSGSSNSRSDNLERLVSPPPLSPDHATTSPLDPEPRRRRTWRQKIRSTSYDQEGGRARGPRLLLVGNETESSKSRSDTLEELGPPPPPLSPDRGTNSPLDKVQRSSDSESKLTTASGETSPNPICSRRQIGPRSGRLRWSGRQDRKKSGKPFELFRKKNSMNQSMGLEEMSEEPGVDSPQSPPRSIKLSFPDSDRGKLSPRIHFHRKLDDDDSLGSPSLLDKEESFRRVLRTSFQEHQEKTLQGREERIRKSLDKAEQWQRSKQQARSSRDRRYLSGQLKTRLDIRRFFLRGRRLGHEG